MLPLIRKETAWAELDATSEYKCLYTIIKKLYAKKAESENTCS